jgi:NAD(P)-dependent dehydrogenase (short-subunit alcohol dehydrogenase family)
MKYFNNKKVLITGASKGIGKACAIRFAQDGAFVIINYNISRSGAEDTLKKVTEAGGSGIIIQGDMGKPEEIRKIWDVSCEGGTIPDSLILNAAFQKKALVDDTPPELLSETLNVNIVGNFILAKLFIDGCRKHSKEGTIVIHSSNQSKFVNPTGFAYAVSKAGLNHMVKHLARAVAKDHIRVNGVILGWFNTDGERAFYSAEQIEQQARETVPMQRAGKPEEAAKMTCFLASGESSYMTGSLVRYDGGFALDPDLST